MVWKRQIVREGSCSLIGLELLLCVEKKIQWNSQKWKQKKEKLSGGCFLHVRSSSESLFGAIWHESPPPQNI